MPSEKPAETKKLRSQETADRITEMIREKELSNPFWQIAQISDILMGNEEDFRLCLGLKGPEAVGGLKQCGHSLRAAISFWNSILNIFLTSGCMKNSCEKNANGKLKHTSLIQLASSVRTLNPA